MKYIRHSTIGFILWPKSALLRHSEMAKAIKERRGGEILSAGFCILADVKTLCFGESTSLDVKSLPDDGELLNRQMRGLRENNIRLPGE